MPELTDKLQCGKIREKDEKIICDNFNECMMYASLSGDMKEKFCYAEGYKECMHRQTFVGKGMV